MVKTAHRMTPQQMQELAERLIKMPFDKAKNHVRRLDQQSQLVMWRVGVGSEIQTRYRLPTLGVMVTLVEQAHEEKIDDEHDKLRFAPRFTEARVEVL